MTVRARRVPVDLTPVLEAVTNDWEPGKVIAQRAGIDPKTSGPRLAKLVGEGKVEFSHDEGLDVRVYRLARATQAVVLDAPSSPVLPPAVEVALTETTWTPLGDLSFDEWADAFERLQRMSRCCNWWLGDALIYGEARFGEKYAQAIDLTGLEYQTIANIASVSRLVAPEHRRESLSWSHHQAVANLPAGEQDKWLQEAEAEGYTRNRLRSRLQGTPKDAPDPDQQLAPTHIIRISVKVVADSDNGAHDIAKAYSALLERKGGRVSHKEVRAL